YVREDFVNLWVQHWLAAADRDDRSAQAREQINPPPDYVERHWIRSLVVFVTVSAGQIAAPHWDHVRQNPGFRRKQSAGDISSLARKGSSFVLWFYPGRLFMGEGSGLFRGQFLRCCDTFPAAQGNLSPPGPKPFYGIIPCPNR